MDETILENVIRAWVAAAVAAPVIWDRQAHPQPAPPYLTVRLSGPAGPAGLPDTMVTYDPAAAAGEEIGLDVVHHHEYTLRVQAFASTPAAARSLVLAVHDRAYRESGRAALRDATTSVALADVGAVQDVGALVDTDWQGRAALDLTLRVADVDSERTTFIQTVGLVDNLSHA